MSNEFDRARENFQLYSYCRENGHEDFLKRTERNQSFFVGKQWSDEELAQLAEDNRPHLTLNEVFRTSMAVLGELSQHAADIRFSADSAAGDSTAEALDSLYLYTAARNNMEMLDQRVRQRGLLFGRGYYDCRVEFDDNLMGQVKITAPRIQNIVLDADLEDDNPKEWTRVFRTRWMSFNQISLTYGKAVAEQLKFSNLVTPNSSEDVFLQHMLSRRSRLFGAMPDRDDKNLPMFRIIEQQFKREAFKEFFVDPETGDSAEVPENWERNQISRVVDATGVVVMKRRTMTMRWLVSSDDTVLHDEDSPYNNFTIVPYMPFFTDGYTFGLIDQMVEPQRMLNKAISQELHILSTTANSGWKIKTGSLKNMTIGDLESVGARTGLILELSDVDDAEKIQPNSVPTGMDGLARSAVEFIHNAGGATPAMFGQGATSEVSGKALIESLNRGPVNMSLPLTAFFNTKRHLAECFRDHVRQYYTETRFVRMTDPAARHLSSVTPLNQPQDDGSFINDVTQGDYFVHVLPAPTRFSAEQNAFAQMVELRRDLGVAIPDDVLLGVSSLPRRAEVIQRVREATGGDISPEQQQMSQLQMAELEAKVESAKADVGNKQAQTELAMARAERARSDAESDGKVMNAQLGYSRLQSEHERDSRRLELERAKQRDSTALELTRLEVERDQAEKDRVAKVAAEKQKAEAAKVKAKAAAKKTTSKPKAKK